MCVVPFTTRTVKLWWGRPPLFYVESSYGGENVSLLRAVKLRWGKGRVGREVFCLLTLRDRAFGFETAGSQLSLVEEGL